MLRTAALSPAKHQRRTTILNWLSELTLTRSWAIPSSSTINSASTRRSELSSCWLTIGRLRQIAIDIGASTADVIDAAARPRSDRLDIADPRPLAIDIAKLRVTGMNQLAAETIATTRHLGAAVRVGEGNHEGRLAELVLAARIDLAVWEPSTST